jgi:hypothetical protein
MRCSGTVLRSIGVILASAVTIGAAAPAGAEPMPSAHERPRPCRTSEVSRLARSFVDAFNRGDSRALARLVAREPEFRWWSTGPPAARLGEVAHDRASLGNWFRNRHARADQLELRRLKVNTNVRVPRGEPIYGGFEFDLIRRADDLAPTPYAGKAGVYCYRHRPDALIVWSMGG